jgi:muconolactone delta-isomerase
VVNFLEAFMLFLVISNPRPEAPSSVVASRQRYWEWIAPLQASGEVRSVYARVGRGAVVLFDVASNEVLHRRLNEWQDIIPVQFEVYPLIDPDAAQHFLRGAD